MIQISLPRINVRNVDGTPGEGWQLFFYEAGSSTVFRDTFADAALSTANANPVLADAGGWFPVIILDGSYNVVLRTSVADGSQLAWSEDNITDIKTTINALIAAASVLDESTQIRNQQYTYAVGSGTGDAINLVITPTPSAYVDGMRVQVRGYTGANTVVAPTINVNSLGSRPIVKDGNSPLIPGDIAGATHTIDLIYSSALSKFILQNPRGAHYLPVTAAGAADALTATVAGFSALYDGMRIGVVAAANITSTTPTLNVNSGGALTIKRATGSALFLSDIATGKYLDLVYRASDTSWLLVNVSAETSSLPIDYLSGLRCTSAADADHDVTVATGSCRDAANLFDISLGSAITKRLDAAWAEGNNFGGLPTGVTLAGPQWLYYFIITKVDGTVDAGFDDSASATNLLADATGYIYYRHIASVFTNSSNNIIGVLNNSEIGEGACLLEITSSMTFPKPPLVDYLNKVLFYGGGGGGLGAGGSPTAGGTTSFDGMNANGGQAGQSATRSIGGKPSSLNLKYVVSVRCGQNGAVGTNTDTAFAGNGGECGIVSVPIGYLSTADDESYPNITGGTPSGATEQDGNNGGGGSASGITSADSAGAGAASVELGKYPISSSITIAIGSGGNAGTSAGAGGAGKCKIWI